MEAKNSSIKRNDNKSLKEGATKELLEVVLRLAGKSLTKHERLILEEFLINRKTFKEVEDKHWAVASLQRRWFNNGLKKLNYFLSNIEVRLTECEGKCNEFEKELDKIKAENANLQWEAERLRVK